jgi:tRNA threonylcarbamoyladenosine biosynthesis protein TsaB
MERGHQERLALIAQAVVAEAGVPFSDIARIGATVGPGSFTGLRVGVAFAKGLASALGAETVAVSVFEALVADRQGLVFAAIDARRDQAYLQGFNDGQPLGPPRALAIDAAVQAITAAAAGQPVVLIGSAAAMLSERVPGAQGVEAAWADPRVIARLAARATPSALKPLYLRAPDARLPGGLPGPHADAT